LNPLTSTLNLLSSLSKKAFLRKVLHAFSLCFFLFFVILPSIFVVSYVPLNWNLINEKLFLTPENMNLVLESLKVSVLLSIVVALIDVFIGLPLGFYVARGGRTAYIIDTLVEIPIVTPTSALGFSVALLWPTLLQFTVQSFTILVLLHTAFTIPYMVRSVAAALRDFDVSYEIVSKTLGARSFTTIRTITLPLIKGGVLTGTILAIARSLSETGATSVALTLSKAGEAVNTAPTLIYFWRTLAEKDPSYIYAGAFVSLMLILISLALFFAVRLVFRKFHIPFRRVYLPVESELSRGRWLIFRNVLTSLFFIAIAFLPALYPITYGISYPNILFEKFNVIFDSIMYSFIVAASVTVVDLLFGIPLSLYIARGGSRYRNIIDYMIEIPIVFPTVAVGISLNLFWITFVSKIFPLVQLSDIILIIFAHIAITYSFTVRTVVNALNSLDQSFEEAAKTLGSTPFSTFVKVVFPQIKFSILAGAIFVFTRSLDETGATLAVAPRALTAPVIIVDFVKKGMLPEAGVSALVLIVFSYVVLLMIRRLGERHG